MSDAGWVCLQTDEATTLAGRCGEDEPAVIYPTHAGMQAGACMQRGAVKDIDKLRANWSRALQHMQTSTPPAIVTAVPTFSTRKHISAMVTMMMTQLHAPAIFLANHWTAVLMSHGAVTGVIVHIGEQSASIAPVVKMKLQSEGLFRLPFGATDLRNPQVLQLFYKTIFRSIVLCRESVRASLFARIVLSGSLPDNFDAALEANLNASMAAAGSKLPSNLTVNVMNDDTSLNTWVGLSIIGSLSTEVHKHPAIEDGVIGAYLTAHDFANYGPDYIFAGLAGEQVLAPVGQGIGQIVSDADIQRPEPEPIWSSDTQYVCMHAGGKRVLAGRCGDDEPAVLLPIHALSPHQPTFVEGAIFDWGGVKKMLTASLDVLSVSPNSEHGLVMSLPLRCCRSDVESIIDIAFEELRVPSVFLCNVWMAALMASGCENGLVIVTEATATCIVPIIGMKVVEDALIRLPIGQAEYYDHDILREIFNAAHQSVIRAPSAAWEMLWNNIVVAGGAAANDDFLDHIEEELLHRARADGKVRAMGLIPATKLEFAAEASGSIWVGLSIIGALTHSVNKTPIIEDQPIGVFVNREQFAKQGPSCAFGPQADGNVLTVEYHRQSIEKRVLAKAKLLQASRESLITTPSAYDKEMVVHQGWLMKQGGGTTFLSRKSWKRRWFLLQGNQLTYHKSNVFIVSHMPSEVRKNATGVINLLNALAIDPWDGKPFGFVIITKDRTFYIHASCAAERQRWLKQLRKAKEAAQEASSAPSDPPSSTPAQQPSAPPITTEQGAASHASSHRLTAPGPQPVSRSNLVPVQKANHSEADHGGHADIVVRSNTGTIRPRTSTHDRPIGVNPSLNGSTKRPVRGVNLSTRRDVKSSMV
eukprot:TRINITY_DN11814_c0_g2_i3.p1 TRINITY_DN11814_c0_g2~~TRINITY_DN11814_c0_g2_i3.p1  ORF type:complete len:870 (+),score=231.05 TRINITY_DN11814_c0_g2_i3:197-2806(+)